MKATTTATKNAWAASFKGGGVRPMMRATIQNLDVKYVKYNLQDAPGKQEDGIGVVTSAIFGQEHQPVELPNIKSIGWTRSVDQDLATMRMTLWNTAVLPLGSTPDDVYEFDRPGYYTNRRGNFASNPWGHTANDWKSRIAPDRVVRTYEGYGFDPDVIPEDDPSMYPSGVWLIDTVEYTADGLINIEARDIGRILADQIAFPPVIPHHEYPIRWVPRRDTPNRPTVRELSDWSRPTYDTDSNQAWVGKGFYDGDRPYVNDSGGVFGHHGRHAFDGTKSTYWLSVGNQPRWESAYEYVQGKFSARDILGVQVKVWGGPYRVYISVYADGEWKGQRKIPYQPRDGVDTDANIEFVTAVNASRGEELNIKLPKTISGARKVRVTFSDLFHTGVGELSYRAGCKDIRVASSVEKVDNPGTHPTGNHGDYTDIIKWFCAWGGFYWPKGGSGLNFITKTDGSKEFIAPSADDPNLFGFPPGPPGGRVWGDIQPTGTRAETDLGIELWDKKPLLDCLLSGTLVKTRLGFKPIEDVQLGELVANRHGYGRVTGRKSTPGDSACVVTISGERIVTTPGHLFWTTRGWVRADGLTTGDRVHTHRAAMRLVRIGVHGNQDAAGATEDLFGEVQTATGGEDEEVLAELHLSSVREGVQGRQREEVLLPAMRICSQDGSDRSGVRGVWSAVPSQGEHSTGMFYGVSSESRVRSGAGRSVRSAISPLAGAWGRVVSRVLDVASRICRRVDLYADRPCEPGPTDSDRGGRQEPREQVTSRSGPDEGGMASFGRVDSVEIYRQGDSGWAQFRDKNDQVIFYDLSVDGDPSFVVGQGEFVVHNCLKYVKDIIGYNFWIDELGRITWRQINYWNQGNFDWPNSEWPNPSYQSSEFVTIDEGETLMGMSSKMSSENVRERVFVANTNGKYGAVVRGWNPRPSKLRRVSGWTDENFESNKDCRVMAKLIAARQRFTFRRNQLTIPGNPAIQIDDQVWIQERYAEEWNNLHYVQGITSDWDITQGKWTYQLTTHWLGHDPYGATGGTWWWHLDGAGDILDDATRAFLRAQGSIP